MSKTRKVEATELMVVNDSPGDECRIAILKDNNHLEELYSEPATAATNVGNIYKGRVNNVEPAIQAAFVDYGQPQNGFLHISDLHPRYFPGRRRTEQVGKKIPHRDRPPMQEALRRGDEVLVQVLKEGLGTKGPTLTSYLSIPGRLLVMMPEMDRTGVSRRVEDEQQRREMKQILDSLELPEGFGFILRTAGFGSTKTDLKRDVAYLMRLWKVMDQRIKGVGAPCELYSESNLLIRTVRDVLRPSIGAIVLDSETAEQRASAFLRVVAPRSAPKIIRYRDALPIFHAFDIERQIDLIHSRSVPLPSGGMLVIEQTEALVAIDVNSGRSRRARDSETNAFQTNCEAVDEISRQLRLRDLGGLIVNDLIDMRSHQHRREIEERFRDCLKRDRAKTTIQRISNFGILEMTRQRMRPSLRQTYFMDCPHCEGHGEIKTPESVGATAVRQVGTLLQYDRVKRVKIECSPGVASVLLSGRRRELVRLEDVSGKKIDVAVSAAMPADKVEYVAYDERNAQIEISKLPAWRPPSLKQLEAADRKAAAEERPERRTRSGAPTREPALERGETEPTEAASPEAAAAAPDAEAEKAAETQPRRKRRRRRAAATTPERGETELTEAASPEAALSSAPPAEGDGALAAHGLARQLGVSGRELIARCRAEGTITLKNHMSMVSAEEASVIRQWFEKEPSAPAAAAPATRGGDGSPAAGRTSKRRPRRAPSQAARSRHEPPPAEPPRDQETPPGDSQTGQPAQASTGATRSRRRRSRGRRVSKARSQRELRPEAAPAEATPPAPAALPTRVPAAPERAAEVTTMPPAAPPNGEKPDQGKRKRRVQKLVRRVVASVGRKRTKVEQS